MQKTEIRTSAAAVPKMVSVTMEGAQCAESGHRVPLDSLDGERLLSIPEVANILGVSTRSVYRLIAEQELPEPVKVRALARMPASDVRAYVARILGRRSRSRRP